MKKGYFSKKEKLLWSFSTILIILSFLIFDGKSYLTLSASLIGATSLIFNAKGNPIGQFLMVFFSLIYGIISYSFSYFGEMITYLGMTMPMAAFALISWLRNPFKGNHAEVEINVISKTETILMFFASVIVTIIFYFILLFFNTVNIVPSTISVTTSFLAAYLTFRRSPYFAVCYALNDIVLIWLWVLATIEDSSYFSVIVCFVIFLFNDIYGFYNWQRIKKRQSKNICKADA